VVVNLHGDAIRLHPFLLVGVGDLVPVETEVTWNLPVGKVVLSSDSRA